ncbi:MAG: sigma-70 family RNA polymerase sigma factor [Chloroflexi bacterium]|nr:MAG: sigma-70 family RNA polymerase sigma factor [Chloroflexota bacterium]
MDDRAQDIPHSTNEPTISALVARCLAGDPSAWDGLVQRFAGLVHSVPVRHGLSPMEVDDVGQEVFLALARHLDRIENPEALPAWLLITARRLSWRAVQKRRQEISLALDDTTETGQPTGDSALQMPGMETLLTGWQRQEALENGLSRPDTKCRDLLWMLFLDSREPSYAVICAQLSIPIGSIGPTRTRCLGKLRSILDGLGFSDAF